MQNLVKDVKNWDDVDEALKRIHEIERNKIMLEGVMTAEINGIKNTYKKRFEPLELEQAQIEATVTKFAQGCKDEYTKTRTKTLNYGVVAYRVTRKVIIRNVKSTIAAMKSLGLQAYIRVKEEPDKDAMAELDSKVLAKLGVSLKVEDKLRIELKVTKMEVI